jgi:AbrB family looped-hinge helix DNA binding protein
VLSAAETGTDRTLLAVNRIVGIKVNKMGANTADDETEQLTLQVDDRGRVTIPKAVRERLGITAGSEVPAYLSGSVLTVDPKPSGKLQPATAGREEWADTTPTDAGEALFGPTDTDDE